MGEKGMGEKEEEKNPETVIHSALFFYIYYIPLGG